MDTFQKERLFCDHNAKWAFTAGREEWINISLEWVAGPASKSYGRTILLRLPQAWVAANLGLAGVYVLAGVGTLGGIALLFAYELWAVRRGYHAWSALVSEQGPATSPS